MQIKRVLFFAEAVTLAHVARPIALSRFLDKTRFESAIACHARVHHFVRGEIDEIRPLQSISASLFLERLAKGQPVYDIDTLTRYVNEDRELIRQVKPDVVIGDFRLSLSISARLEKIPYATLTNAYWSPFSTRRLMPLPLLPLTRWLPIPMATALFNVVQPLAFASHCKALNRVRADHNMASLGNDIRRAYTDADHVLYADIPSLFPTAKLPDDHQFIGPLRWSPPVTNPAWWDLLPRTKPVIYVTLGSSGQLSIFRMVLDALADLPVTVIASTAGSDAGLGNDRNAFVAPYLDGDHAAARSQLVICNGGSPTSQQAIAAGVPVLGIASNMDQFLNMAGLVNAGAGLVLRADRVTPGTIKNAVSMMLSSPELREGARTLSAASSPLDQKRLSQIIDRMLAC